MTSLPSLTPTFSPCQRSSCLSFSRDPFPLNLGMDGAVDCGADRPGEHEGGSEGLERVPFGVRGGWGSMAAARQVAHPRPQLRGRCREPPHQLKKFPLRPSES